MIAGMSSAEHHEPTEDSLEESAGRVDQLAAEIDRQRSSHTQRSVAMNTRAALLISAAGVFAGMGGSAGKRSSLDVPLYVLLVVAAVLGLWALWPRKGPEVKVGAIRDDLNNLGDQQVALHLLDQKLLVHDHDEKSLRSVSKRVTIGFTVLAVGVAVVAIRAFL
jgi:hypothetical protein